MVLRLRLLALGLSVGNACCDSLTIHYRQEYRQLRNYGVAQLQAALQADYGYVEAIPLDTEACSPTLAVALSTTRYLAMPDVIDPTWRVAEIGTEGYHLLNQSSGEHIILAKDGPGSLYGVLELAKQLTAGNVQERVVTPHFAYRALKFNLPESAYRPGLATNLSKETVKDLSFWKAYLDMMVANKFNVLSLWQLHPWQYMIKSKHYPHAALPDDELRSWRELYTSIFKLAQDRAVAPYIVNWDIFVSEGFKVAYDQNASSDKDAIGGDGCTDEIVKVYNRECIVQVVDEYPDLAGKFNGSLSVSCSDFLC
jgi:hypothetical protein